MDAEILIVSNGPGELASWVRPVVRALRETLPCRVTVALVPCPYASGHEAATIAGWPEPVTVWAPETTLRYLLTGRAPAGFAPLERGAVLFLGGDQLFAVLLSLRSGYPLLTYVEEAARWRAFTKRYLVNSRNTLLKLRHRRSNPNQLRLVGNLMVDAVQTRIDPIQARRVLGLRPDGLVLGLLPGSKPFKVHHMTPLFLRVAEILQRQDPTLQVVLHRSPFTPREQLVEAVENPRYRQITGGAAGRLEREGTYDWLVSAGGARVLVVPPDLHYEGLAIADLALTVPGTNTAELAVLGVPMLVALPLHKPEEIPLDGLVGRIGGIPLLGRWLKRALAHQVTRRKPLLALPNQRAGRLITPELIGAFAPETLAEETGRLLADAFERRDIKLRLHEAMGGSGAAAAVVEALREVIAPSRSRQVPEDPAASQPQ
ncbi:MAG TPA: hypothetical protein V6D47_12850 [Oscillatoriaceae cyanobacterium]